MADDPRARLGDYRSSRRIRSGRRRPRNNSLNYSLSYTEMCLSSDGAVLRREQVEEMRERQGFCPTCFGEPVQLYDIQRSRFNPLSSSKEPRTVPGDVYKGQCLRCHPEKDPNYSKGLLSERGSRRNLSRPMADRMTSTSRKGGFAEQHLDETTTQDTAAQNEGDQAGNQDLNGTANQGALRSMPSLMKQVTSRMNQTMTTLAEVTMGDECEDEEEEDKPDAVSGIDKKQPPPKRLSAGGGGATSHLGLAAMTQGAENGQKAQEEENPEGRLRRLSSQTKHSEGSSLEEMFQQCHRNSAGRSTRRSTLITMDVSQIDFGDISDSDSESGQPNKDDTPPPPKRDPVSPSRPPQPSSMERQVSESKSTHSGYDENETDKAQQKSSNPQDVIESTLSELDSLVKDLTSTGNPDFAVDVLTEAMKTQPEAEAIQVFSLGTILNFCRTNSAIKASLISSTAPDDILLAMQRHIKSPLVQERGCGIVRALSVSSNNRRILNRAGAISRILRALEEHPRDEHVVSNAVGALRTLSPELDVRKAYIKLNVKSVVLDAMELHRLVESIQRDGIVFLSNSAIEVDGSQVAKASSEELHSIVKAMAAHQNNMSVKSVISVGCFALKNYSYDERNVDSLLRNRRQTTSLLEMAAERSVDPACRNDAKITLERISMADAISSSMREESFRKLSETSSDVSVSELMTTIENRDESFVADQVKDAFERLLQVSHGDASEVADKGNLEKIVAAMKRQGRNSSIQEYGCAIFENLSDDTLEVIEAGGCGAIAEAMRIHGDDMPVLIAAFKALRVLSVNFECWFELEQSGRMKMFRDTFNRNMDNSSTIQETGTDILMNFSAYSG